MHTDPTRQLTSDYNALVRAGFSVQSAAKIAHCACHDSTLSKELVLIAKDLVRMARESLKEEEA